MHCIPIANSNIIYFPGDYPLNNVKKGDFLQLKDISTLFQIKNINTQSFTYPAEIKNKTIIVNEKIDNLLSNDNVKIIYDSFEIDCILIREAGTKFRNLDVYELMGGAAIGIQKIDSLGRIQSLNIKNRGIFYSGISKNLNLPSEGNHCSLEVIFRSTGKQSKVININAFIQDNSILNFMVDLGDLKKVDVYYERFVIELEEQLPELKDKFYTYSLYSEYTPNYSLPLLPPNALSPESIINRNLAFLDRKIKELEESLNAPRH